LRGELESKLSYNEVAPPIRIYRSFWLETCVRVGLSEVLSRLTVVSLWTSPKNDMPFNRHRTVESLEGGNVYEIFSAYLVIGTVASSIPLYYREQKFGNGLQSRDCRQVGSSWGFGRGVSRDC